MNDIGIPETRIKEYYCEYNETTVFKGQFVALKLWRFKLWKNMKYTCHSLESAKRDVDLWIGATKNKIECLHRTTEYHKYP